MKLTPENTSLTIWLSLLRRKIDDITLVVLRNSTEAAYATPAELDDAEVKAAEKILRETVRHIRLGWALISEGKKIRDLAASGSKEDEDDEDDEEEPWWDSDERFHEFVTIVRRDLYKIKDSIPVDALLAKILTARKLKKHPKLNLPKGWQNKKDASKRFVDAVYKLVGRTEKNENLSFLLSDLEDKVGRRI